MNMSRDIPNQNNIAVFAEHQTAGRGRRGRSWISPFATNIYFSLLWHFNKDPAEIMGLSLAVGVAVAKALQEYGLTQGIKLKWPNDVLWQRKKLAGILVEMVATSHEQVSTVVGIGINTAMQTTQAKDINQAWTSIEQITGQPVQRNHLAALLTNHLVATINKFSKEGLSPILSNWRPLDALINQPIRVSNTQNHIDGTMTGISPRGELLLKDKELKEHRFFSGEVSVRLT
jgi:BirA family transcriptional regulator, biotin operon repressor / biotin---[acetyl-CoA-carboxylase] ligase